MIKTLNNVLLHWISNLSIEELSNFFIDPHKFVFLSQKQAKISAFTVSDHGNYYAAKKAKPFWPDSCISVFGLLAICCWAHFARSKKKVLDSANFYLIFKIQTLNSCGSPFFNRRVLLSFRNNSFIILMLYSFNCSTTDWGLISNCIADSARQAVIRT